MNVNNLTNVYNQNPSLQGQYTLQQYLDLYGSTSATPTTTATPAATPTPVQSGQSQGIINSGINQFQNGSGGLQQQGIRSYTSLQDKAAIAERKKNNPNYLDTIGKYGSKVVAKFGTLPGVSQSKGLIANIMDNTMVGRFAAMRDATNPDASNYNPNLVTQKDYALRGVDQGGLGYTQDDIGRFSGQAVDPSKKGYNPLAGIALQSIAGTNDLGKMLDNERTKLMGYFVKTKNLKTKAKIDAIDKIIAQQKQDAADATEAKAAKDLAARRAGNIKRGGYATWGGYGTVEAYDAKNKHNYDRISEVHGGNQGKSDADHAQAGGSGMHGGRHHAKGGRVGAKDGGSMIEIVKDRLMKKNPAMWGVGYEGLASLQDLIMSMPFNRGGIVNIRKR